VADFFFTQNHHHTSVSDASQAASGAVTAKALHPSRGHPMVRLLSINTCLIRVYYVANDIYGMKLMNDKTPIQRRFNAVLTLF
jgi:hypothetical protein